MSLIVTPAKFPSKAVLKANLEAGCEVHEPSIMGSWTKMSTDLPVGFSGVIVNHPERTKFAQVRKTVNGWEVK